MTVRHKNTPPIDEIIIVGGRLCLDFINTANWINGTPVDERLDSMHALSIWAGRQKIAISFPGGGEIAEFLELRRVVHRILTDPANACRDDLATLNQMRREEAAPLANNGGSLLLTPEQSPGWLKRLIADSACEVILCVNPKRLKTCSGDRCGWMYVDESPNNRRRWCSMATCGNRAKAKRHYQTHKIL